MEFSFFICGFLLGLNVVGSSDVRSSLTIVIDDTGSMGDDIQQVKIGANAIFDTVMKSNSSQIEDFVLVTFNDPGVKLRTITKNREEFKKALAEINVDGGVDCPEMAMSGIELALRNSRDGSVLYVFTDASATDYEKYDEIEALCHKMGSQIVFVLTGVCSSGRTAPEYLVYRKIAKATNGEVFHLETQEIGEILNYVRHTIENRKNVLTSKTFSAGYGNTFDVVVDGDTKELTIAVSGESPSVDVTDSGGTKWPTTDITRLSEVAIVKVVGVKPDVYKVEVGSKSETHVVVSGSTSVHFQHGFSVMTPSAITDTVKRPVPGEKSHLSIRLATEGGNVELHSVQILDMDDKVFVEKPLKLVNKADQFYTTTDLIAPPNYLFKVAIKGYDTSNKSYLTRISLTPVKPQEVKIDTVKTRVPSVIIDGSPKTDAEYDKPLQLKCKVNGYPKPSVIWLSDDKSAVFSQTMYTVELPYDYVSVLDIRNVKKNATYSCKAVNSEGSGDTSIAVQTKVTTFFKALLLPEDMIIEYQKQRQIPCKAEGSPPATATWYKDRRPLRLDANTGLTPDGSVLTIRSMEPYMVGDYLCETRNSVGRKIVPFRVDISGVESPEIRKDTDHVVAKKNSKAYIQCQVVKGHPKPILHWLYKGAEDSEYTTLNETTDTIHFDKVQPTDAGAYRCIAESDVDWDHHEIELSVEYKPSISREFKSRLTGKRGDTLTLTCPAEGNPTPEVTWRYNGAILRSHRHTFFKDGSIRFSATLSDRGVYECEARNVHGVDSIRIDIDIIDIDIESPAQSFIETVVGTPVVLPCRADGNPKPRIMWVYHGKHSKGPRILLPTDATGELRFSMIQQAQDGRYTCVATNTAGSKNITYEVSVLAPPSIQYTTKQFRAVIDDMQLRIPCEATGNPKPGITWSNKEYSIASGSEWYNIGEDGSLIIKNLDKLSEGSYICIASNELGEKAEDFNVIVDEYPKPSFLSNSVMLEEGTTAVIPCSVPQRKTDRLRWFKDGRLVSDSELKFNNVTKSDAGTYTCRVSFVDRPAQSASTKVEVGFKPQFSYLDDEKNIAFEKEVDAFMDCTATGNPEPEVKWFHDGRKIAFTGFRYEFIMTNLNERGRYTCEVTNRYGTVRQEFVVSSFDCLLDIKNDFNGNEPLMLTTYDTVPNFDISDGYLHIPHNEMIKLSCPSGFNKILSRDITVICEQDKQFILQSSGDSYAYSALKCRNKLQPSVKKTGRPCTYGKSEMYDVGFEVGRRFMEIYQICIDVATQNPIYAKLTMQQPLANVAADSDAEWFNNGRPVDLDSLYDCSYQNSEISAILDKEFHRYDRCCFSRKMLVNPKDVAPGLPQAATYTHLNVAPHWGTCHSKNWEDVEQRVRDLVTSSDRPLQVWTGTAQALGLPDTRSERKDVIFKIRGQDVQVPMFFWKVVQDSSANASLAIIQVNVPDLRSRMEAASYRLCTDVCKETKWMQNRLWRDVNQGYVYCCSLEDFERAFRYHGVFPRHNQLLKDVSFTPDSHYLHAIVGLK